ncbi:NADPH-dependent FMN reductase [Geothrix sp. PMB-07]|uniref:NADPH-dependent FMN reductase n=1 Tax=Geothrix sp. PMB-07 TaxID=3068640 RepID=UPI00274217C8|nr:NAD(P)H-dependent oxidoreductase [Geothrix sp. PMB-07]WLT31365.1 NAD(P)H-dependent oxidoreductase [Geothrix sp. PMB-07]
MRVLALSGSLRAQSLNARVLREAARLAPDGMDFSFWERLDDLPHFSPERDEDPLPPAVADLRARVREADALLFCTPEYIHAMPAVLKNLLEWVVSSGACVGKPTAAWSVSPSLEGGARAQASLVHTLEVMSAKVVPEASLCLTLAHSGLDGDGHLRKQEQATLLCKALRELSFHAS